MDRGGRVDIRDVISLARPNASYLSVMIEAGSKVNWAALESGAVDKVFLYYAPKILGGLESLPMAGGTGRLRRMRRHPARAHHAPPHPARRIRRRRHTLYVHRHH